MVELREEKKRPALWTYGLTTGSQDIHKVASVASEKTVDDLLRKREGGAATEKKTSGAGFVAMIDEAKAQKYADTIRAVRKNAKTVSTIATVSLPVSSVFHALVVLPVVNKNELDPILKAEAKKLLPRPVEEMALDYHILPSSTESKTQKVIINAVPRELVSFYSRVFQLAGLSLDALEPESAALARALIGRDTSLSMLIDMGAERTSFFIVDQSVPITHRSIESGGNKINSIMQNILDIDWKWGEQVKYDLMEYFSSLGSAADPNKFLDIFMPVIDPIIKEIEYSFDIYLKQTGNEGKRPEKIILTGGAAIMPFLPQYISERFKIKCYVGDPWGRVIYQEGLRPVLRQIGPRMSVAVGLALRNMV